MSIEQEKLDKWIMEKPKRTVNFSYIPSTKINKPNHFLWICQIYYCWVNEHGIIVSSSSYGEGINREESIKDAFTNLETYNTKYGISL